MKLETAFITGATGFVGRALALRLRAQGCRVVALVRKDDAALQSAGIELVHGELGVELPKDILSADVCFHVASKVGMWGRREDFERVNVLGTSQLLALCVERGIRNFVYTSSPSVIADGSNLCGVDESIPYPSKYDALYPETKAAAERLVMAQHRPGSFNTVALRPHLIFGPSDTNLLPSIVRRAQAGTLKQVGDGENLSDFTYIDDCVTAHTAASLALLQNPSVGGRPYFISQGDPYPLWLFVRKVLAGHGLSQELTKVPYMLAATAAYVSELIAKVRGGDCEPALTRFLVSEMATHHYFSIEAAREKLKFAPSVTVEEGLARTFNRMTVKKSAEQLEKVSNL